MKKRHDISATISSSFLLVVSFALFTPYAKAQAEIKCEMIAFVTDPDSVVELRSGPGKQHPVVKVIPKDPGRSTFSIVGSDNGWLKVTSVNDSGLPSKKIFSGVGWALASDLAVTELRQYYRVFELPSETSPRIDISLFDAILPLKGCKDRWVKVQLPVTGTGTASTPGSGWLPDGSWCGDPAYDCET